MEIITLTNINVLVDTEFETIAESFLIFQKNDVRFKIV